MANTNVSPYFDDFNEKNNFHRILYRPSYAVQARELTQQQTILQNQTRQFGNHVFKNGAMVIPGHVSLNKKYSYVKIENTFDRGFGGGVESIPEASSWFSTPNASTEDISYTPTEIVGVTSGVRARVINGTPPEDSDDQTLYYEYISSPNAHATFIDGEVIEQYIINSDEESPNFGNPSPYSESGTRFVAKVSGTFNATVPTYESCGYGSISSVEDGVYYIDGFFVNVEKQSIIIDKYSDTPSVRVGLRKYDTFVAPEDNPSLNDNAQGSYNYAAPGAHRLKINMKLEYVELDSVIDTNNFIQLQVIENGILIQELRKTEYGELRKEFAHRTFDESGHYTVNPFVLTPHEHYLDPSDVKYKNGIFDWDTIKDLDSFGVTDEEKIATSKSKLVLNLDPGKAYVYGYEFETISPVNLTVDKARETAIANNSPSDYDMANYVIGWNLIGTLPIESMDIVNLKDRTDSIIGTARIRQIGYKGMVDVAYDGLNSDYATLAEIEAAVVAYAGDPELFNPETTEIVYFCNGPDPDEYYFWDPIEDDFVQITSNFQNSYKFSLFDIIMEEGSQFKEVQRIDDSTGQAHTEVFKTIRDEDEFADVTWYSSLFNTANSAPIMPLANSYVKTLSDTTFPVQMISSGAVSAGKITISVEEPRTAVNYSESDYIIFLDDLIWTGINPTTDFHLSVNPGTTDVIEIDVPGGTNYTVFHTADITESFHMTKDLEIVTLEEITITNRKVGGKTYLPYSDVYKVTKVYEANIGDSNPEVNGKDVTSSFYFDNGQRDSYYDLASIELRSGQTLATDGTSLFVSLSKFNHSGNDGYFTADSYPSSIPYEDIPIFTGSSGKVFPLSDCIDFRPKIGDEKYIGTGARNTSAFAGTGSTRNNLPKDNSFFKTDYEYYLPRIDIIVLDPEQTFRIIKGEASSSPRPPTYPENSMKIYEVEFRPYGINLGYVLPKFIENKRYTMRDIGSLEKRIKNLEYFSSLSLLESDTANMKFTDEHGLDRFKHGFIVEPFTSHGIGNYLSADYNCAIDPHRGRMRPRCSEKAISFVSDLKDNSRFSVGSSSNVQTGMYETDKSTGDLIAETPLLTLEYTHKKMIEQQYASRKESVNPYMFASFLGAVAFIPSSDFWKDEDNQGTFTVNNDAHYGALASMAAAEKAQDGVTWGAWQTDWIGVDTDISTNISEVVNEQNVTQAGEYDYTGSDGWVGGSGEAHINRNYNVDGGSRVVDVQIDRSRDHDTEKEVRVVTEKDILTTTATTTSTTMQTTVTQGQSRKGTDQQTSWGPKTISANMGNRLVSVNHIPFMRKLKITVSVKKFRPNTVAYAFFDRKDIYSFIDFNDTASEFKKEITESGETNWQLFSNENGEVVFTFKVPEKTFYTGDREMFVTDLRVYGDSVHTKASGTFRSHGLNTVSEDVVMATKTIDFAQERKELNQSRQISATDTASATSATTNSEMKTIRTSEWIDPLAQSIIIEEEGGCFITKCDLFFSRIPTENVPIMFQIREMVNGYPGPKIIPYSDVILNKDQVAFSTDATVPTTFYMEAPVYLKQGVEYAIVILADTIDYEVWVSHMSMDATESRDVDITTGVEISKQPYLGTLFKSQNASTWTAEQQEDLKFTLYKAEFDTNSGIASPAIFGNNETEAVNLTKYSIFTTLDSPKVRIYLKNHGMPVGSKVLIEAPEVTGDLSTMELHEGSVGITYDDIVGEHNVEDVEFDSFVIDVTQLAGDGGVANGTDFTVTPGIQVDCFMPILSTIAPAGTSLGWQSLTTSGQSISGSETAWIPESEFSYINEASNNFPRKTRLIANRLTEDSKYPNSRSMYLRGLLTSNNANISPVINTEHMACALIGNRIDSPTIVNEELDQNVIYFEGWNQASNKIDIHHENHGMTESSTIELIGGMNGATNELSELLFGTQTISADGVYPIEVIDIDTYSINLENDIDSSYTNSQPEREGGTIPASIKYSTSHSRWVNEEQPLENSLASRYMTTKISLLEPSSSLVVYVGGIVQRGCDFDLYYRYMNEYDDAPFYKRPWIKIDRHNDQANLYSTSPSDSKEYKFHLELITPEENRTDPEAMYELPEPFIAIAMKIVMRSTDTTRVPEFNDLRIICLGE